VVAETAHRVDFRPGAPARRDWTHRTFRAIAFGLTDSETAVVALAGFLVRGGILVLLVPSVVLPSVLGAAAVTGVDAFGIDGRPTTWLYQVAAVVAVAAAIWLLLAFIVGSLVDAWLIDAALDTVGGAPGRARPLPSLKILLDLAGVRAVCALPLIVVGYWAGSRIYTVSYNELTAPTNLETPMVLRVFEGAADAIAVLGLAWLASEVIGAIAVRRTVLLDHGIWQSLGGAAVQLVRRPLSYAATVIVSYGASAVATVLSILATAAAFDWCNAAARSQAASTLDFRPVVFILTAFSLGLAWVFSLAVSGIASAWRSAAFTEETAAAADDRQISFARNRLGLSGPASERSGD
jgi:hypothetical protein